MNAVTTTEPMSAQTLEHVLGTGDLGKLTTQQRVEYYARACQTLGLNPLTRPFRFLSLNGQIQMYATRDCTDQLRKLHKINLQVIDKQLDGELFIVTVRARTPDGREDEDMGAVVMGRLSGDSRANAIMRAMTKAKRRVTLSIVGLGLLSEDELDTMPGAMVFDAEDRPPTPIRAAAADTPRAPTRREEINQEIPLQPQPQKLSWSQWADSLELTSRTATIAEIGAMLAKAEVTEIVRLAKEGAGTPAKARIIAAVDAMQERYLSDPPMPPDDTEEAPEIKGEQFVGAG